MNATTIAQPAQRGWHAEAAAYFVAFGAGAFLLLRPSVGTFGLAPLAMGYVAVAVASSAVRPRPPGTRTRGPWIPLAVGATAVLAARLAAGAAPPLPLSAAIVALNTAAAVAEEAFFRGFLFGRLERQGVAVAVIVSALTFALLHLPLYGTAAFPVDLGAGLLLSWQRAASGSWGVPAATHAFANLLAVLR